MHDLSFLPNIILILATAVMVVVVFRKFHLSPVLGYFVAGAAIGEHGFNIVTAKETEVFGEFGVVFLLFAIGLELTFERLKSMRTHVFWVWWFASGDYVSSNLFTRIFFPYRF